MIKYEITIAEMIQLVVASGALIVAAATILHTKIYTRKSKTADLLMSLDNNKDLIAGMKVIRDIQYSGTSSEIYAEMKKEESAETHSIRYILNHLERVAACVENNIYDFSLIKATQRNRFIKTFEVTKPYILKVRENTASPEAYVALERLVKRLEK